MNRTNSKTTHMMFAIICIIAIIANGAVCITYIITRNENKNNGTATQHTRSDKTPAITVIQNEDDYADNKYSYIVDRRTGVVYLEYSGYRSHGVTVMLNPDGTVITADQLELEYEPYTDNKN